MSESMRRRRRWVLLGGLCLLGAACWRLGCDDSSSQGGTLVPVEGRVLVNGQPLALREGDLGKVWFYPDASQATTCPVPPSGDIGQEGYYTLSTGGKPGAPPGRYQVMLIATRPSDPRRPFHRRQSLIHGSYCAVETSGLLIVVAADSPPDAYDLKLRK
jgi:hypothetical protein